MTNKSKINKEGKHANYCCPRFEESVKERKLVYTYTHNKKIDETAWFMPEWLHIYYCPFCGEYIKGKGYGKSPCKNKE